MTLGKQRWRQVETFYHAALGREPLARGAESTLEQAPISPMPQGESRRG